MKRYLLSSLALVGAGLALACGSDSIEPEVVVLPDPIVNTTDPVAAPPPEAVNACDEKAAENACTTEAKHDPDHAENACETKPQGSGNRAGAGNRPGTGRTTSGNTGTVKGGRGGSSGSSGSTKGGRGGSSSGSSGGSTGTVKGGR